MRKFILIFLAITIASQNEAFAYINPGTGSDFFQMLAAIVLGVINFFKQILNKIKSLFGHKNKDDKNNDH